jgi:transcription elongation factor Elf1/DNA-binding transcriptional ArsR family regulator
VITYAITMTETTERNDSTNTTGMTETADTTNTSGTTDTTDTAAPSEAFQPLGNEVRTKVLRALLDDENGPRRRTFSELAEASGVDTTAGFAYHLRQLTNHYLRETDEGYTLTDAGVRIARAIASGAYTDSVDRDPVPIEDPCPFCDSSTLIAEATDNTVTVSCKTCEQTLLRLPFPPGGHHTHTDEEFPAALDRLYRHRVALMTAGSCPECGGASTASVEYAYPDDSNPDKKGERTQLHLDCTACGNTLRCPVTFAVLDHPAVVSFYHERGIDVRKRPIWNVGREWRETLLSDDPWCVRVSTEVDGDGLELLVGQDTTVIELSEF